MIIKELKSSILNKETLKGVKKIVYYNKKGEIYKEEYFNDAGLKIKVEYKFAQSCNSTYTYDDNGTKIKSNCFSNVDSRNWIKTTKTLDNGDIEILKVARTTGELILLKIKDANGNIIRKETNRVQYLYKYTDDNRLIEKSTYMKLNGKNFNLCSKFTYEYICDDNNILTTKNKYIIHNINGLLSTELLYTKKYINGLKVLKEYSKSHFTTYSYDNDLNLIETNYSGRCSKYREYLNGRLIRTVFKSGNIKSSECELSYNDAGLITSCAVNFYSANGQNSYYETYSYDENNRLVYSIINNKLTEYIR